MAIAARNQPQGLAKVNSRWANRKLAQLVSVGTSSAAYMPDAMGGGFSQTTNGTTPAVLASSPSGKVLRIASTGYTWLSSSNITVDDYTFIVKARALASGTQVMINIGTAANPNNWMGVNNGCWGGDGFNPPSAAINAAKEQVVVWRRKAGTITLFVDGVSTGTVARPNVFTSLPVVLFQFGISGGYNWQGDVSLYGAFASALTDAEVAQVSANPWQLFDAPSQSQFPMAAAAPAGVSGSITWTEASDSAAAAGSVTVSGAAAWTEAADSAALAGSVGSAVGINAAWTEAADSVAIAGSAQVNAAAAWTEAADAISIAGSAGNSVAANISWTEAADVTTVAGTIRINAAGSWTEAGDTAAIVVNVAAAQSAALSWTEAPDSIAIAASITAAPVVGTIAWTEQADIAAKPTYPGFYSFTLMRSDPISSAGAMSSSSPAFTLMRANAIASSSKISDAPLNQNVNLI